MKGLVKLALLAGGVALAAKFLKAKKAEWEGLSEAEVREKVRSRLPDRVPEEKREQVADRVVEGMRTRGVLAEEVAAPATEETPAPTAEAPEGDSEPA